MLNLDEVARQLTAVLNESAAIQDDLRGQLEAASETLKSSVAGWQPLARKMEAAETGWLFAQWLERPDAVYSLPPSIGNYTAIATDGSQTGLESSLPARLILLNTGRIALRYGDGASATLKSMPLVLTEGSDLLNPLQGDYSSALMQQAIPILRLQLELAALKELLIGEASEDRPVLCMVDGPLVLWVLEPLLGNRASSRTFQEPLALLSRNALDTLMELLDAARERRIPVVGYISGSAAREFTHSLRLARCPHETINCDYYCPGQPPNPNDPRRPWADCYGFETMTDRLFLEQRLKPGERSALFGSRSKVLEYYREHRIRFFYLNTGAEIARVEMPQWVSDDPRWLSITHALVADQAKKGGGYPVALSEAHEQAVIRGSDREDFIRLVQNASVRSHHAVRLSRKALAKRARRI